MKITVKDAAKRMGLHEETVRFGLREGRFPFGTAVQMKNRWNYIIFPKLFEEMVGTERGDEACAIDPSL